MTIFRNNWKLKKAGNRKVIIFPLQFLYMFNPMCPMIDCELRFEHFFQIDCSLIFHVLIFFVFYNYHTYMNALFKKTFRLLKYHRIITYLVGIRLRLRWQSQQIHTYPPYFKKIFSTISRQYFSSDSFQVLIGYF